MEIKPRSQCLLLSNHQQRGQDNFTSKAEVKVSPSKKFNLFIKFIVFNESPLKMMKNAIYFILKALFGLKIFKFLSLIFDHV